ncbi:prepilin-type N-terminal cleavage/methylation domain-containing protein [Cytobacillus oceanisediminis]|uniref:Prepilin-type N-terminal cleavage/methylation domain-containing protein n=1 Tax=Niallia alba TaxID=2729105 RepID=A0A7Y0KA40_9BACI|nr:MULTISPECIES: prepilin-type N-terminal cleavage/methylation domain-containing protein [Bacillaceae]MBZ9534698.1 prepilin-type N-terminal cleavage/methylation domain-containing protein [Cytobacillus oceanisediminis]NMO78651.1 prepilin-type N-terminal cleavage/methylation domain-containing protein [Niallia alba]UTI41910.1 prepilin-type N-terminal cleavage/methylation domain-containing protein [Niallia sp. RD1]
MRQLIKQRIKNEKGLTLIELLAVIVILGIIAAIAIPSISGIIQNSKEDAVRADAITILNAAKNYAAANDVSNIEGGKITQAQIDNSYVNNLSIKNFSVDVSDNEFKLTTDPVEAGKKTIEFKGATIKNINAQGYFYSCSKVGYI